MFRHSIGNMIFKQDIGISIDIDSAPLWANLYLYFFESKYIKQLILYGCFQALMTFHDNEFLTSFKNIYPKELDLKVKRQGNHVSLLDLDIKVEEFVWINLHYLLSKYPICQAIYHLQFPLDPYFQNLFE